VEEYEGCCQELGVLEWLPNFYLVDKEQLAAEGILPNSIETNSVFVSYIV
jgi:hypothetical protein